MVFGFTFTPYRFLEKMLLEVFSGVESALLVSLLLNALEYTVLVSLLWLGRKRGFFSSTTQIFAFSSLLGLTMGWGKAGRDSLLVFFPSLSQCFGYSQFLIFPSHSYLLIKTLEVLFEVEVTVMVGRVLSSSLRTPLFLSILFLFRGTVGMFQTAVQFIPPFRIFSLLYSVAFLPLLLIIGASMLWYLRTKFVTQ